MDPDLLDLMTAWSGGEVTPARLEELLARLRRDEAFRLAFVAEIRMLGMLRAVQAPESRWLRLKDELGWNSVEAPSEEGPEDRIVRRLPDAPLRRQSRRWKWVLAAAAAVLLVAGLAAWWSWPREKREAPAPVAAGPYPKVDTMAGLAMVIQLDDVHWETTVGPHPAEGDVLPAGRLILPSGRATLSMLTGVVLFVEGPAELELVSDTKVLCRRGRLRVRVPNGARGFVVSGPSSAVLDLGTEYGLNVEPGGTSRGMVFRGGVEAALLDAAGTLQRTDYVKENETFEVDPRAGRIETVAGSNDFIMPSNLIAPPLTLGDDYPAAVRRSRPWGYWRFESMADGAIPNEVSGRPRLRVIGPIDFTGATEGNRCAVFPAMEAQRYLQMEGPWQPSWRPGYAVELWFLSELISHATLAGMTAPHDTNNHCFLLELTARSTLLLKPASVRLLHRWPPAGSGGDNLFSPGPFVPYRWHHVVGQINGDRMELFVDGEPTPPLSVTLDHADTPCLFLLGRLTTKPGSGVSFDRPLVGRMDEVALYDRPLTIEEIREHHRLGARPPRAR